MASIENSSPMAGRAMLIEDAMKGGKKEVKVAMTRAHLLISGPGHALIDTRIEGSWD
jgi:hypothetical protein